MNAPADIAQPAAIRLTAEQFRLLRGFGAFDEYWKAELLDGELWGVPADGDEEPESDAVYPIKLTTDHYELLDRAGAFTNYYKTELIDGRVYAMSPQYRPHGYVKNQIAFRLHAALIGIGSALQVATEQSVKLADHNEPQPDIILTSEARGLGAIPGASVSLLVEVADTSNRFDRTRKASMYAMAGIPEYWIANVNARTVRRYWGPNRAVYQEGDKLSFDDLVFTATIEKLAIDITDL